jgi:hypothetical protein
MSVVSNRAMIVLGAIAAVVATVSLAGLVLSALVSPSSGEGYGPKPPNGHVAGRVAAKSNSSPRRSSPSARSASAGPTRQPTPAGQAAQAQSALVPPPAPALLEKPARGPSFAIARLRPGASASIWRAPGRGFVETLGARSEFGSPLVLSVVRRSGDWLGVATPAMPNGSLGWIRLDPGRVELYWTRYSLHVDLSGRNLSLRYGTATVGRFLVTVGGPGTETPVGRYGVTDALNFDESPAYGCCALALSGHQTRLLDDWTGGDRLAIHGTPGPVGGAESHGCIRATDDTMRTLFRRLPLGTPVFVDQ